VKNAEYGFCAKPFNSYLNKNKNSAYHFPGLLDDIPFEWFETEMMRDAF